MARGHQLVLPFPRPTAAERRAWIGDRLSGYEFRQSAREEKRRLRAARRKRREVRGTAQPQPPSQLSILAPSGENRD